ncbi:MAG: hypothetical protein AAGU12_11785 [Clostridiales bacterium]
MFLNDLQSEWAFYGRKLDVIGHLYVTPAEQPSRYPDLLFFCLYTARLLVDKKLTLSAATEIQKQLRLGQGLEKAVNWDEDRQFSLPARVIEYKGYAKSAISSSLLFRNKLHFRFAYMGFGLFSNGRHFDFCASASVFALLERIYCKYVGSGEDLAVLWDCAEAMGKMELGAKLNKGNCLTRAKEIYQSVTGDQFPALMN